MHYCFLEGVVNDVSKQKQSTELRKFSSLFDYIETFAIAAVIYVEQLHHSIFFVVVD